MAETILSVGVCFPKVVGVNTDLNRGRSSMHIFSTGCVCVCVCVKEISLGGKWCMVREKVKQTLLHCLSHHFCFTLDNTLQGFFLYMHVRAHFL